MAFVMPSEYSINTIPKPVDERISILEIPKRKIAALRFSGRWTNSLFEKKSKELLAQMAKQGIKTKGAIFSMRYSSPYTPWFLRRNEVAIEVEI
jgi:effector-binding domain-containing protein